MTSGGPDGTSGARIWRIGLATIAGVTLAVAAINALSVIDELHDVGQPVAAWQPWLWEYSSAAFWLMLIPVAVWLVARLRHERIGWPRVIAAHLALTLPVSAAHILTMVAIRTGIYRLTGAGYDYGWDARHLLYEYRKDVFSYLTFVAIIELIRQWAAQRPQATVSTPQRLEVRDGARTTWLDPADIERVEAAGNYVELSGAFGTLLHRATLAGLERELAPAGFVRIHRSHLVRRAAVASIVTNASGDFEAVTVSGARLPGSRRFRAALDA